MLAALGVPDTVHTEAEFREFIDKRCSKNMAALISEKIYMEPKDELLYAPSIWKGLQRFILAGISKVARSIFALTISEQSSTSGYLIDLKKNINQDQAMDAVAGIFGVAKQLETFKKYSDLISLYMMDSLLTEMKKIVMESGEGTGSDPKKLEEAKLAYQESIGLIGKKLAEFKPEETTLVQKGLHTLVSFFGSTLASQQGTEGLFDIATPLVSTLAPAWKDWLTKPNGFKTKGITGNES